jgi:anaerobic selenocysteine-containing dehydrogenase
VEDSMSMVHRSVGCNPPASPWLKSEPAIIAGIAVHTLNRNSVDWEGLIADYSRIRDKIEQTLPIFKDFNSRIREPGGFRLPNCGTDRTWGATGKARFVIKTVPDIKLADGILRMMTIRSHDQFNTTVYSNNDRYRGISQDRRVLLVNPVDIAERDLEVGDLVDVISVADNGKERRAEKFKIHAYDIPEGCIGSYFPETNVLVPIENIAEKSRTPVSKFIPVRLEKR